VASKRLQVMEKRHDELDFVQGNWKQVSGKVKQQWGKSLTTTLRKSWKARELEGKLQERYGLSKDEIKNNRRFHDAPLARFPFERNSSIDRESDAAASMGLAPAFYFEGARSVRARYTPSFFCSS